jgi:SAM-dependent methyltransferase
MTLIPPDSICIDDSSYVDPSGRLFSYQGSLFRGFFPEVTPFFRKILSSEYFTRMQENGRIVGTRISEYEYPDFDLIVEHDRIAFVSYCCEWSPVMLRDAAILLLELIIDLSEHDVIIVDGHPSNILFDRSRPVFVDVGSLAPADPTVPWPAYQQFCNTFLHPIYLCAAGMGNVARVMSMNYLDGLSQVECSKLLPWHVGAKARGIWSRVRIPALISRINDATGFLDNLEETSQKLSEKVDMKRARRNLLRKLLKTVRSIDLSPRNSRWAQYYEKEAPPDMESKSRVLADVLDKADPASLVDIGCNTGLFSMLAARKGIRTVAFDTDESSISRLYLDAKEQKLDILPLVMNVVNFTPSFGWMAKQFPAAPQRLKCEAALAFSLIHHLAFTQYQDFERIVSTLDAFTSRYLFIEYVDPSDPMAEKLVKRCRRPTDFYSLEALRTVLSSRYRIVETAPEYSPTRTLLVCEK